MDVKGSPSSGVLDNDSSSGLQGESASVAVGIVGDSASVLSRSESVGNSLSLEWGRGIEMQLSILTCGLPCSQLKSALFYVIGNLGQSILVDCLEHVLWGDASLLWSLAVESLVVWELERVDAV